MTEQAPETSTINTYTQLLRAIQSDPYAQDTWKKTVTLARDEEEKGGGAESYYTHVPLDELIVIGERLRATKSRGAQYDMLTERASTGERWYDIILGHSNDKMFRPIAEYLEYWTDGGKLRWERCLDVGSGTGNTLRTVAPYFEQVVGVDKLESVLQKEKSEGILPENVDVVAADATRLPFDANTFNVAVSNGLTHYISKVEMRKLVRELARVLKPNGVYLESVVMKKTEEDLLPLIEMDALTSAKALLAYLIGELVTGHDIPQPRWTLRELVDMFAEHGFGYATSETNEEGVWFFTFYKKP